MTIGTDANGSARANAAWSLTVQQQPDVAKDMLRKLDPIQLLEVQLHAGQLTMLASEVFAEKLQPDLMASLATALLTPDCPSLPDGVEGFPVNDVHTLSVCTWCGCVDCKNREEHLANHRVSETTWRRNAKGIRS